MNKHTKKDQMITAVVADENGHIFDLEGYAAVGMNGPVFSPLTVGETKSLPHGSELMLLPDRWPVAFNLATGKIEVIKNNPFAPNEKIFPVAAFNSPGYVILNICAYRQPKHAAPLPLFSYGAVGWHGEGFRSAVARVDVEPRQDLRQMPIEKVEKGVRKMRNTLKGNRLRHHLENCALTYGCPAGKNFFLGRFEAPLPTSKTCNASCLGCISLQDDGQIPSSQNRIGFTPTEKEIADVALAHIQRVKNSVVSFGQGCEGDPLMAAKVIGPAIKIIRAATDKGTINMNTNGSLPHVLKPLFAAGLDSIRVSMNSLQKPCYNAYFRPRGYTFEDVVESIDLALSMGKHVAINYLNCPGFTDTKEESRALTAFLEDHPIHMIQWRNLNFDPLNYLSAMKRAAPQSAPIGMRVLLNKIRNKFPGLTHGYFNPPKERFSQGTL